MCVRGGRMSGEGRERG